MLYIEYKGRVYEVEYSLQGQYLPKTHSEPEYYPDIEIVSVETEFNGILIPVDFLMFSVVKQEYFYDKIIEDVNYCEV